MKNRLAGIDSTCSAATSQRRRLVDVLEGYLADLERGVAQDQELLLAAHQDLASELRPYLDSLRLLHGATRDLRPAKATVNGADVTAAGPRQVGDYRIMREIGRGGMGIVYEAHQCSLNRQVALKVLPFAAVLDQRQIARFRNEAQAAAQLHHAHIVPVYAVGQELGVYYYAMQYIHGQSLDQAIGELRRLESRQMQNVPRTDDARGQRSTTVAGALHSSTRTAPVNSPTVLSSRSVRHGDFFRAAARLGKEAAEALGHAHEYGILHRDVKPSNLLIDEQGKLWVTDFGLARMQTESGVTLTGDVIGTLRYMSPEQAAGRTALVDARTDVYSLGVTLYELLTQRPAFPGDDRQNLLQKIINEEPIPPRRLNPAVPVDLETIVLAAMAKSREERYASAQALADDLARFLAGEPTSARRPSLSDRAAKWARRHRPLVAVGACAMVMLSVVLAVGMVLLAREQARTSAALTDARESARTSQLSVARAERHFQQARGAVDQFGMRLADRLLEIPGAEAVRRELLLDTLGYYRQFMAEAGDDPQLRQELALAHFKSAAIAARLGAVADAIAEYEAAQRIFAELSGAGSANGANGANGEALAQLAVSHNNLGLLLAGRGDVKRARDEYSTAIAIQARLLKEHAANHVFSGQFAESQANLGMLLDQTGDADGAERSLGDAVDVLRPLAESLSDEPKYARNLAIALNNQSFVFRKRDVPAAERAAREAIAILERLGKKYPDEAKYQDDLALCYNNAAALAGQQDRLSEAIEWHTRAISRHERLMRKAPAVVRHRSDLAVSLNNLGVAYSRADRPREADAAFARARELLATLAGDYPNDLAYQSSLAGLLNNQALALAGAGRHKEALSIYPTAIESQRKCWTQRPESPMMREVLSKMYYNYGQTLRAVGRIDQAAAAALARREVWRTDGERLLGVAVELAQLGGESGDDADDAVAETNLQKLDDEVVATLRQADHAGWPQEIDLTTDERFAPLRNNKRFAAVIAELDGQRQDAKPTTREDFNSPSGTVIKAN